MKTKHYPNWDFAEKLEEELQKKGLSKLALARKLGVDRKTVYGWCGGVSSPDIIMFGRMCRIFKVSSDYMLFGEQEAG